MINPDFDPERSIAESLLQESEQESTEAQEDLVYPQVVTNNRPLRDITANIVEVLEQTNDPPVLFTQSGHLVRLRDNERGHWIEPVNEYALRRRLTQVADVVHQSGDGERTWHIFPTLSLMRDVLAMDVLPFPLLEGITETPIVKADGAFLDTPSYDATSRLLYRPPPGFTLLPIPEFPSVNDVAAAVALIHEPLEGFPVVDEAALANTLALLLTPILRHAINGPVPLALIDAPQAGTGKSLLARVISMITTGRSAAMMTAPGGDEEWRKRLTASLISGSTLIIIDNVEGALTAPSLAAALTTDVWTDRLLGVSEMVTLAQRATWIANGNNIRPGGDLPRRCYWIRLDAKTSRPWQRTGFRFPDLITWVASHRRHYVSALLLLARAWYAAGQPEAQIPTLGGFESWTRTVGGILTHAGIPGFLSNLETMYAESDDGASQWEAFFKEWRNRFDDKPITMADLTDELLHPDDVSFRESLPDELADMLPIREGEEGRLRRRLGHAFRKRIEQRFGEDDLFLARAGDDTHRKVALWRVISGRDMRGSAGSSRPDSLFTVSTQEDKGNLADENPPNPAEPKDSDISTSGPEDEDPSDDEGSTVKRDSDDSSNTSLPSDFAEGMTVPYRLITAPGDLLDALAPLANSPIMAIDTETTGLDPLVDQIRLIQLAILDNPVIVIDLWQIPERDREPLQALLSNSAIKIFHNAKFDLQFLQQVNLPAHNPFFDTMLASQLLDAGLHSRQHGLADLTQHFLGVQLDKAEQVSDWSQDLLTPEQLAYAAKDVAILLPLRDALFPQLETAGLMDVAQLEWDCLCGVAEMELTGIGVDGQKLDALRQQLEGETNQAAARLRDLLQPVGEIDQGTLFQTAEDTLNLDSPAQVLAALQALGVPVTNTNRGTLTPFAETYPVVGALLEYRRVSRALTFATSLPEHIHPRTGRIHATYWQLGAATGRFSCSDPNLQQIPKDKVFRECFIAALGYRLVIGDYSQIELRTAAELSQDARMVEAYGRGEDLHALTASLLLGKSLDQVTRAERQAAKAVNFGLIFAMGAPGLQAYAKNVYGVTLSLEEAVAFRERFFTSYPGMVEWHRRIREEGPPRESRTLSGRRRQWRESPGVAALYNTPVQGTAADITKQALAWLPQALAGTDAKIVGTVHDEILVEAPEENAESVAQILKATMELAGQVYLKTVPVIADIRIGLSWAEV
jgi:DNA polymerase-1